MIAVDTNVVSELMKGHPDPKVLRWSAAVPNAEIAVPTIVVAELVRGIDRLATGQRRRALEMAMDAFLSRVVDNNLLPFDGQSAIEYAWAINARERSSRPMTTMDALIAATCRAHGVQLATRNTKDFQGAGISLIDPWA